MRTSSSTSKAANELLRSFNFDGVVNWFPGHMAKALRQMQQRLTSADVVIEVRDARVPMSSYNSAFESIIQSKSRLIVLNKADLASTQQLTKLTSAKLLRCGGNEGETKGQVSVLKTSVPSRCNIHKIIPQAMALTQHMRPRFKMEPLRIVIIGLPNVGKSSIINAIRSQSSKKNLKGGRAQVGGKPGTTRGQSCFEVWDNPVAMLIDTPGVMLPHVENNLDGLKLALLGIVRDGIVPGELLTAYLLHLLNTRNTHKYVQMWGLEGCTPDTQQLIHSIRSHTGVQTDDAASKIFISKFRKGQLGKIVLDEF